MFSFRTTAIAEQTDKALVNGPVGLFCTDSCWDASTGKYLWEVFRERGALRKVFRPDGCHIVFDVDDLAGLAAVVVEIQDVGSRYFPYTVDVLRLMNALKSLPEPPALYIVDHPNPAGRDVEGTIPAGLADQWTPSVAHRHGLTLGELCNLYADEIKAPYGLHVISAEVADTARILMPWTIPPAHDFPGVFTPYFYSGGSLWNDTNVSPGIGTKRPYEILGAPWLKADMHGMPLPEGVLARPLDYLPVEGIYSGTLCHGFQFILTPGTRYHSLLHTVQLMHWLSNRYSHFHMSEELYTRVADPVIEEYLRGELTYDVVEEHVKEGEQKWIRKARRYTLYDDQPARIK